jgi:hypothetical protein
MAFDEFQDLAGDAGSDANVAMIDGPVAQLFHLGILGWHDADGDLGRLAQVWTVRAALLRRIA